MVTRKIDLGQQDPDADAVKRALFDEYGHHLENIDPALRKAMQAWVKSRATANSPVPLNDLIPGGGYKPHEIAYPDPFLTPYVGKVYKSGDTEVLSVGIERFRSGPAMVDFMADDEEHFVLVLGVLAR